MTSGDPLPIFYEKGLHGVAKTYFDAFGRRDWSVLWPWNAFAFMLCIVCYVFDGLPPARLDLIRYIDSLAGAYVSVGIGAFGMILAGFAILFSALDSRLTEELARFSFRRSGHSTYNVFLSIFIFGLVVALIAIVSGWVFYFASLLLSGISVSTDEGGVTSPFFLSTAWLILSIQVAGMVYILSAIKGFIVSLHQVMLFVADAKVALHGSTSSPSPPQPTP